MKYTMPLPLEKVCPMKRLGFGIGLSLLTLTGIASACFERI